MNKKRWLAIAISVIIVVASTVLPTYQSENINTTDKSNSELNGDIDFLSSYLGNDQAIFETVIEAGEKDARILELTLDGAIMAGSNSGFSQQGYDHDFFLHQLDLAKNDPSIKAVLFVVNTPGGGVFESAEIRRKIMELQANDVPVYVTMQHIAASGGYYISASADKIFATSETWTGSIGVIMSMTNYRELFEKYGIHVDTFTSGDYKDMGSPTGVMTEGERKVFQSLIDESYQRFVDIIVEGRGMSEAKVRRIADGRIYTAQQAVDNGLVDAIAYKEEVLSALRTDFDLGGAELFRYQRNSDLNNFMSLFSKAESALTSSELDKLKSLVDNQYNNSAPRAYYLYGGE